MSLDTHTPHAAPAIQDLTGAYTLDPAHTRLGFVARHAMVTKVRGHFAEFDSAVHLVAGDPTRSTVELRIKVASVTTGDGQRDAHLRGPDFFDVETHPEMVFRSTSVEPTGADRYRLTGDLTIKDVTRPVTLAVEYTGSAKDPFGNLRAGFEATADVNRKDFGLTWNAALEAGGILVSDKVKLEFDVSAIKHAPTT
jgi:polyisoprenoid-binding protein YceI